MAGYGANSQRDFNLGLAWLVLTFALAIHVLDEAVTGFLAVYNPTVLAVRARYFWFPMPTFSFRVWLTGLICGVLIMLALSPLFFRGVRWLRSLGYFMAMVNILNAFGHITATILGRTVASVHFPRPAPGFYSSPFLLIASLCLLLTLRRSRSQSARAAAGMK